MVHPNRVAAPILSRTGARLALCAALSACDGAATDTAPACTAAQSLVNWENFGAGFIAGYCRGCHSATTDDRNDAPAGVDFDTLDQVRDARDDIYTAVFVDERMPVGGGVADDDLAQFAIFLDCGL